MPPLTPEEQAQLAAMYGYQDYGSPTMTNYASQLNLFQDIMQTMQDPTFLYLQGLLSDQEIATQVEDLLFDPIEISTVNWIDDYNFAQESGNSIVAEGMSLIIDGFKIPSIITKLRERTKDSFGSYTDFDQDMVDAVEEELKAFEEKYLNAKDVETKVLSGEYMRDASGNVYKPVDQETGQKRLQSYGFRGYQANPESWRVILNAPDVERAQKLAQESTALTQERANKQKSGGKEVGNIAQSVYKDFLNRTPEGRRVLEGVTKARPKIEEKKTSMLEGPAIVAWRKLTGSKEDRKSVAGPLLQIAESLGSTGGLDKKVKEVKQMQNQDYWAKLGASYAGRAAQDEKRKELERLDQTIAEKNAAANAAMTQARAGGTSRAQEQMKMAPYFAAMIAAQAQPEKKKTYVKPKPRVLSDAEIETMANMIAGGMG
jgi:hypothetical protein